MIKNADNVAKSLAQLIATLHAGKEYKSALPAIAALLEGHTHTQQEVSAALGAKHKCVITEITLKCPPVVVANVSGHLNNLEMAAPGKPTGTFGGGGCIPIGKCVLCIQYECSPA